jgi:hypothetical protein
MSLPDTAPLVHELLTGSKVIRLATVTPDGEPHVAVFWYHFDGERIVITTFENASVRNLREHSRVAFLIDRGADSIPDIRGALLVGEARAYTLDEAPPEVRQGHELIFADNLDQIDTPAYRAYRAKENRRKILVEILPSEVDNCWDFRL